MAKRSSFSSATGVISATSVLMLSPGMTISTPSKRHHPRHIGGPEVKLRPVAREKRRVPPAFLFFKRRTSALNLVCGLIEPGLATPAPLHFNPLGAAQQHPDVIPRLTLIEGLAEHLDARAKPS